MKKTLIWLVVIVLSTGGSIPSSSQVQPRDTSTSQMIIDVEPSSQKGVFHFAVSGQRIPDHDILGFLNKHWNENSERTVPIVMIPASLTVLEIGSIQATFTKAGYHKVRFFLYAKNCDFVEELIINKPVPKESIRGPIRSKR